MILSVDQLREHVTSELGDDALQRLLDAAEEAIVARAGEPGTRTELFDGGQRFIALAQVADSITSISELILSAVYPLAVDDYLIHPDGMVLERLSTGTFPSYHWLGQITVIYVPVSDDATRAEVQIALCQLDLGYAPGIAEETIGDWTERYTNNSAWNVETERESILSRLNHSRGMVVV